MQKMFSHQKCYEIQILNEDIFNYIFQSDSDFNVTLPTSINFGIQLPSFNFSKTLCTLMPLCKKVLKIQLFH